MTANRASLRSRLGQALILLLLVALAGWLLGLHAAPWPAPTPLGVPRWLAIAACGLWLALCLWSFRRTAARSVAGSDDARWLVIHASQTGTALELATRTANSLRAAGLDAGLRALSSLEPERLKGRRCLFVVSTTGEGDPPDAALAFVANTLPRAIALPGTGYALLALGDRGYAGFCAFGHQLDGWLRASGAQPLFDMIEVDNADPDALRRWQHQLGMLVGRGIANEWDRPQAQAWTLRARHLLNPGSAGGPAFHLLLQPADADAPTWQAGDIAEIHPRHANASVVEWLAGSPHAGTEQVHLHGQAMPLAQALACSQLPDGPAAGQSAQALADSLQPLPHREYSIASIPADGSLELLVRLVHRDDGRAGLGSGWLCRHALIGDAIALRIRSNPGFHRPADDRPLILIGNGTGLAGLRALLKARIADGAHRNWLLFGERSAQHDAFFGEELAFWLRAGKLEHLDRVYSRDSSEHRYVQDALRAQARRLRQWLDDGAAVYVCGSLQGMAPGVDAVLVELLGDTGVQALRQAGRYRRDVY